MLSVNVPEAGLLAAAAAQAFGIGLIVVGVVLLISAAAFLVLRSYMRAIFRESQRSAPTADHERARAASAPRLPSHVPPLEIHTEHPTRIDRVLPRSPTFRHAERGFRRGLWCYLLGGSVHVAGSVALLFVFDRLAAPAAGSRLTRLARYGGVWWCWSVITLVTVALFCGPDRPFRWRLVVGYAWVLAIAGALLHSAGARGSLSQRSHR